MSFRRTRKSSDGYSWLTLALSLCGALGCGAICINAFMGESQSAKMFTSALFFMFGIAFAFSVRGILFPYEWELVIESDLIRWGETTKPQRQRRLRVPNVKRLIHDKSDSKVLADVGSWRLLPVGDYILMRAEDQAALVEHLRQSFPSLKIETT
jgi:hypothetical protein